MFLGHVIKKDGIAVDSAKIEAVTNWVRPANASEVRSFFGLIGCYKRFVWRFSNIAMSMTKLLQKDKKFEWNDKCKAYFTELKMRLIGALILT